MSESLTQQLDVPRIPFGTPQASYLDLKISDTIQGFMGSLVNEERAEFRDMDSLTKKLDHICWVWGQNPETEAAAVGLKSLIAIRTLEDAVASRAEAGRDYQMPVLDPFWHRVDVETYNHLKKFVSHQVGVDIPPFESLSDTEPTAICLIDDYLIARRADKYNSMVHYAAIPTQTL